MNKLLVWLWPALARLAHRGVRQVRGRCGGAVAAEGRPWRPLAPPLALLVSAASAAAQPAALPSPATTSSPALRKAAPPLVATAAATAATMASAAPPIVMQTVPPTSAAAVPTGLPEGVEQRIRQLALDGTRSLLAPGGGALRVEVAVGALDARLRLAPCQRIEPHLPVGSRLWGATRVGLRCLEGAAHWNVFVPVTVKVHGRGLVAAAALPAGAVLTAADLGPADVDLADDASPALADAALVVGRTLQRPLQGGQSLRASHLKPRQWFAAGDTVRVQAGGDGFTVSGEAVALTRGIEGETARVRTESGRVLTGMPLAERRIALPL